MSGKIADKLGRRKKMGLSEMFCLLGWLAILFSKVPWLLDAGRLSIGYGIGVLSYVVPVYIAEITPQNLRGAFTTVNQIKCSNWLSASSLFLNRLDGWQILVCGKTVSLHYTDSGEKMQISLKKQLKSKIIQKHFISYQKRESLICSNPNMPNLSLLELDLWYCSNLEGSMPLHIKQILSLFQLVFQVPLDQ
uniref:Sugar transporter ERD6-like 5 isoform X2 n=1 Tax=Tanacetum cinerariifolium TaxID=118510 RepID=A0A6L2NSC5_TANCI|nr:sugar transporter ERD6-like 5 isoform X2 [Tanacetum cinerariifolium]